MPKANDKYIRPPANVSGNPDIDHLNSLLETLNFLDDRGLVLALSAFAEATLGMLLIAYMRNKKQAKELVEDFNAPLGTFSARIKAAFALGLLHHEQYHDLDTLRIIRNAFAHDWAGVSFERQDIKDRIKSMHAKRHMNQRAEGDEWNQVREGIAAILIELRLMLKQVKRDGIQLPDLSWRITDKRPIHAELVEVDQLTPVDEPKE